MEHAQLTQVWDLLAAIVARQTPFAQIMITLGTAFFIVMVIEGIRTSILAMRRGHEEPRAPSKTDSSPMAAPANDALATRLHAARAISRPAARPLRKLQVAASPVSLAKRLTPAIRRIPHGNSKEHSPETTSF